MMHICLYFVILFDFLEIFTFDHSLFDTLDFHATSLSFTLLQSLDLCLFV